MATNPYRDIPESRKKFAYNAGLARGWDEGKAAGKPDRMALATIILEADNPQHHIDVTEAYVIADAILAEFYKESA